MSDFTKFDYLLNAMEEAALHDKPADHGYGDKRKALFAYVLSLESVAFVAKKVIRDLDGSGAMGDETEHALRRALRHLEGGGSE